MENYSEIRKQNCKMNFTENFGEILLTFERN